MCRIMKMQIKSIFLFVVKLNILSNVRNIERLQKTVPTPVFYVKLAVYWHIFYYSELLI